MHRFTSGLIAILILLVPALAESPFVGRWDFNITTPAGSRANWLGVTEKEGKVEVWFQPTGGNLYEVKGFQSGRGSFNSPCLPRDDVGA